MSMVLYEYPKGMLLFLCVYELMYINLMECVMENNCDGV